MSEREKQAIEGLVKIVEENDLARAFMEGFKAGCDIQKKEANNDDRASG